MCTCAKCAPPTSGGGGRCMVATTGVTLEVPARRGSTRTHRRHRGWMKARRHRQHERLAEVAARVSRCLLARANSRNELLVSVAETKDSYASWSRAARVPRALGCRDRRSRRPLGARAWGRVREVASACARLLRRRPQLPRAARTPPTRSASPRAPPPPLLPNGTRATPRSVLHLSPKGTPRLPPRPPAPLTPRTSTASPLWR